MPQPKANAIDKSNPKPKSAKEQKDCRDFLKLHKHDAVKVDKEKFTTDIEMRDSLLKLHGVDAEQYRAVGGSG